MISLVLYACVAIGVLAFGANGAVYSYSDQAAWSSLAGSFCGGRRQSPINIVTGNVVNNPALTRLQMNQYWNTATDGTWSNNGHTLQFTPSSSEPIATTTNFIGRYELRQFHFHWGPNATVGSENTVNDVSYSGELHFVHENTAVAATSGSRYAVVAVFLRSNSSMSIASGSIWDRLNTQPDYEDSDNVTNIIYSQLLPSNLDYYYFPGSLTTPLCNEIVEWFVLKTSISVPAAFFRGLRTVEANSQGTPLTLNYRNVQPLNGRTVSEYNSAGVVPALTFALLALSVVVAAIVNI